MSQRNNSEYTPETAVEEFQRTDEVLQIENLSKSFRHVDALKNISMTVGKGEVVGLVGENGAGKSTLLKILTGIHEPDAGDVILDNEHIVISNPRIAANKGISLVHQEQDIIPNLTGYENLYLGQFDQFARSGFLDHEKMHQTARDVIDDLGIDLDLADDVSSYSFSDRQMLEIAKAFSILEGTDRPLILLDEPTAGLEQEGRDLLFDQINKLRDIASFIFVSHELDEVIEISDRIYVLKDGQIVAQKEATEATEDNLESAMVGRDVSEEYYHLSQQREISDTAETALSVEDLNTTDGLSNISFELRKGEILGVVGLEGSGKSRLGRVLAGKKEIQDGSIHVDGNTFTDPTVSKMIDAGIGYVPKERKSEGLLLYQSVKFNVALPSIELEDARDRIPLFGQRLPLIDFDYVRHIAERSIEMFDIKTPDAETKVENLSGGNQQKVVLAKWLVREIPILVSDNVTRGIDVGAKAEVYRLYRNLAKDDVSMVFIGDELPEVIAMSNRILVMKKGRIEAVVEAPADDKPTEEDIIQEMI